MIDKLIVEAPLNALSLGQVSVNILKSLYKKGIKVYYSPIGQPDISAHKLDEDFKLWLNSASTSFLKGFNRKIPCVKIWHVNGSQHFPSDKRILLSFHETDGGTLEEINIIKNTDKTLFCGNYSKDVFSDYGLDNIGSFNLGFDKDAVFPTNRKFNSDGRVNWSIFGKAEGLRKGTYRLLSLWAKKYGLEPGQPWVDGKKNFLHAAITNPFYNNPQLQQYHQAEIHKALEGKRYYNIHFYDYFPTNAELNEVYNQIDIDITGLSRSESWNIPAFNVTCLGGWSVVLNATGHKSWANAENSVLVNPTSKIKAQDNIFFYGDGSPFNNGNFFDYEDAAALEGMEKAEKLGKTQNIKGLELQEKFTYDATVDSILKEIENL